MTKKDKVLMKHEEWVKEARKKYIKKILDILHYGVIAEGGDGWGLWYSSHNITIDEIFSLLVEYNSELKFPFEIVSRENEHTIHWINNQEHAVITTDENTYLEHTPGSEFILIT